MDFFKDAFKQIKQAGIETLSGVGDAAVAGVTSAIAGANPTSKQNNAPDIGVTGAGHTMVTQPTANMAPPTGAVAFLESLPTWAKFVGGSSVLLLVAGVGLKLAKG